MWPKQHHTDKTIQLLSNNLGITASYYLISIGVHDQKKGSSAVDKLEAILFAEQYVLLFIANQIIHSDMLSHCSQQL